MKRISINNGISYCTVKEALAEMDKETIATMMDRDTKETVHAELAPCKDEDFLTRYLELAPHDLVIG